MRVLITGISGFVGKILHEKIRELNHEIYGIDSIDDNSSSLQIDITDFDSMQNAVEKIKPDFVFHLAAISRVDINDPQKIFNVNINGTLNLLSACLKLDKKPEILLVSSSQVYGIVKEDENPVNEHKAVKPVNLYGASKAAVENIAAAFFQEFDLPVVIARPFNHTGKGQAANFVIPKIIQAFREKRDKLELGTINVARDYLDVRDVVNAYIKIMQNFRPGEKYNISSGLTISLSEIISQIEEISCYKLNIITNEGLFRKNEIESVKGDSSKIQKELGWSPEYDFKETLKWMLE
ncbi:MAG: GDP-mannose 4,6-dehydratase [Spirochaetes bacterium]|nr:GDP-mannose 4,6-dehydratase [Spirochaetota bacterium]